jgi:hypothetical protein
MKELTLFLEQLANKLGTTVEKLWAVLLRQATISGIVDLILSVGLILVAVKCLRFVKRKTSIPAKTKDNEYPRAEWEDEGEFFAWSALAILLGIVGFFIIFALQNIMTAFLNPEYWALKEIFSAFKK